MLMVKIEINQEKEEKYLDISLYFFINIKLALF